MKQNKDTTTIRIAHSIKAKIEEVAKLERRTFKDQLELLIESGYEDYKRQQKVIQDIKAGKTQLDPSMFLSEKRNEQVAKSKQ